jgi:flagellar basal-body rod modification protein FlgD
MELTPTSNTTVARSAAATKTEEATVPETDFQTFLTLLTAQMRNQDPLKPMESTEFVAQLASFSSVEQQVRSNDRLDKILSALGGGSAAGIAQWIGREVRAPVAATFDGVPIEVEVTPRSGADQAMLVVRNALDQEVSRRQIDLGADVATWDGLNAMGQTVANGKYSFTVESYGDGEIIGSDPGRVYDKVSEVRLEDGEPVLILEGGERAAIGDISGVR